MLAAGDADGSVGGALNTTGDTAWPAALWTVGMAPGVSLVSSFFLMISPKRELGHQGVMLFADCAVVPGNPLPLSWRTSHDQHRSQRPRSAGG